jgi:hypothetical protein
MSWLITPELKSIEGVRWQDIPADRKWTPASISTALWLDAADSSTITQSGGLVSQWNDKSGNSRHATASGSTRPAYSATSFLGQPSIEFDGTDDFLATSSFSLSQPFQFWAVFQQITVKNDFDILSFASANFNFRPRWTGITGQRLIFAAASPTYSAAGLDSNPFAWGASFNGTTSSETLDGTTLSPISLATAGGSGGFTLARTAASGNIYGNVRISEAIVVPASTDYNNLISGYLAHKWGMVNKLPSNHPYKVNPPAP